MTTPLTEPHFSPSIAARSRGAIVAGLLVCGVTALLDGADAQSFAIAAPLIAKLLSMPSATVGLMFSCAAIGSGLGYLVGGLSADRWGARAVVSFCAAVAGIFQLATNYVDNVAALIAVRIIVSLGLGGAVPGLLTLVSQIAPPHLQHRLQGLLWACFPLGVLSGGLLNGWILNHDRWQTIFIVGGTAPLVVAVALWGVVPFSPNREIATRRGVHFEFARVPKDFWGRALLTAIVFFFTQGAIAVVMNWTPSLLVRAGLAPAVGAHALAWNAIGALISMTAAGFIVERYRIAPIIGGLTVGTVATILLSFFLNSLPALAALMVILGAALALAGTAAVFMAGQLLPDRQAGGIGICMAIGRVGQMVFPGLIGLSLQAGGSPSAGFLLSAVLPAAGALATVALGLKFHDIKRKE